jgi:hypothetical protein
MAPRSFYQSLALLGYIAAFLLATHLLVAGYEEPTPAAPSATTTRRTQCRRTLV